MSVRWNCLRKSSGRCSGSMLGKLFDGGADQSAKVIQIQAIGQPVPGDDAAVSRCVIFLNPLHAGVVEFPTPASEFGFGGEEHDVAFAELLQHPRLIEPSPRTNSPRQSSSTAGHRAVAGDFPAFAVHDHAAHRLHFIRHEGLRTWRDVRHVDYIPRQIPQQIFHRVDAQFFQQFRAGRSSARQKLHAGFLAGLRCAGNGVISVWVGCGNRAGGF